MSSHCKPCDYLILTHYYSLLLRKPIISTNRLLFFLRHRVVFPEIIKLMNCAIISRKNLLVILIKKRLISHLNKVCSFHLLDMRKKWTTFRFLFWLVRYIIEVSDPTITYYKIIIEFKIGSPIFLSSHFSFLFLVLIVKMAP